MEGWNSRFGGIVAVAILVAVPVGDVVVMWFEKVVAVEDVVLECTVGIDSSRWLVSLTFVWLPASSKYQNSYVGRANETLCLYYFCSLSLP